MGITTAIGEVAMKTKRVNRYYCEFCTKANCSAPHMKKHEKHCTMNPSRECGVCGLLEQSPESLESLIAILPDPADYAASEHKGAFDPALTYAANDALPRLREATNNCPACIMAAIRQAGIPVPMVNEFDWTKEMKDVWAEVNDRNAEGCYGLAAN